MRANEKGTSYTTGYEKGAPKAFTHPAPKVAKSLALGLATEELRRPDGPGSKPKSPDEGEVWHTDNKRKANANTKSISHAKGNG